MKTVVQKKYWVIAAIMAIGIVGYAYIFTSPAIDFSTQVKPILNKKCITCHGGVRKKSDLSFLFRTDALTAAKSGKPAIIPGDPDHSEMIRRLLSNDPEERMPYHAEKLEPKEIEVLRQWIREGAKWGDHWAYTPVKPVTPPRPRGKVWGLFPAPENNWVKNDIDYFIQDKLKEIELEPAPPAKKNRLLRRVSLDLIGLPAPDHLARKFLEDTSGNAYETLVDSLLDQPAYGEKWTAMWMDLARYADTKGYERDDSRSIWRYRDWLIRAFNEDKPYDSFLVEQIAGDLLPEATDQQLIATAFHRNTMTNDEGGTENEEFRTSAVIDRVNTTWEALMGTTFGCVQCHSHPYDPFRHEDYYKFMAFFNNTRDEDTYADYPLLHEYQKEDSLRFVKLKDWLGLYATAGQQQEITGFLRTWQPAINGLVADSFVNSELADTKWLIMRNHSFARIRHIDLTGKSRLLIRYTAWPKKGRLEIHLDSAKGHLLAECLPGKTKNGWSFLECPVSETSGIHDLYISYRSDELKKPEQDGIMFDWFYFTNPFPGRGLPGYDTALKYYDTLLRSSRVEITPVMMENPSYLFRTTHVFERGNWLVKGETVKPDVPKSLNPLPAGAPGNRMGLALWLVDKQNPLTSRAFVNRIWEQIFGTGIAETLEDLGTQGSPPTHRELLDYLAWQFMHDYKWSIKRLVKEMVMSATYQQDSKVNADHLMKDPFNKYYSRGPRIRLSAEQLHDQALAVSGLLNPKMYGKSVMPYQPRGIWLSPWNGRNWNESTGEDQYRRAIYTYWKRTAPYPAIMNFDGAAREVCTARRIRTNTPLQALGLLNDSLMLNAARQLAYQVKKENIAAYKEAIRKGYFMVMQDTITDAKLIALERLYDKALTLFRNDEEKTCEMIGIQNENNNPETAALVVVSNALLNMDEFITKN